MDGKSLLGRKKHYSGTFCSAPGCSNSSGKDKHEGVKSRSYYTFPLRDSKRLKLWLRAIPREQWFPTKHSCICSDHFPGGKKTAAIGSEGYIPTLFPGADTLRGKTGTARKARKTKTSSNAGTVAPVEEKKSRSHKTTNHLLQAHPGKPVVPKPSQDNVVHSNAVWLTTDHDYVITRAEHGCMTELKALQIENKLLRAEVLKLKYRIISLDTITDDEFPTWTNLPNRLVFDALADHLEKRSAKLRYWHGSATAEKDTSSTINKPGPGRSLSFRNELFLVLVKLKTGYSNQELHRLFQVSTSYISMLFTTCVNWLAVHLTALFQMPQVGLMTAGVPQCYQKYPDLVVVLDCTEVAVQKATNLQARKELYSNYKGRETMKFLIGLSPYQTVNFVSAAWGGRASDKHITLSSDDLLHALPQGSSVMTDRGFDISKELKNMGVELIIPCFKGRGRSQMSRTEFEASEQVAEARIHVERIIQRIRTFKILHSTAKLSMKNILSEVFICCAYLVNFQLPIVKSV